MLTAAAVCPHPPLLVPEVAGGAAAELDELRAGCDEAVGRLLAAGADLVAVVGAAETTRDYGADPAGSLRPYGLDLTVGTGDPVLPLSLTIGRWLLERGHGGTREGHEGRECRGAGAETVAGRARWQGIAGRASAAECLRQGTRIAALAPSVALLCMGDGGTYRGAREPGYADPRAAAFDATVAAALGDADADALAGLDPVLAAELTVAGRPAWQVLAGAAGPSPRTGELIADQAPYGVRYYVASWR